MNHKFNYLVPTTNTIIVRLDAGLLTGSVAAATGSSSGENITIDGEYDPW